MAREINLVPDVKEAMIKALKLRNLTFFICIVVASASVAVSVIAASIAAGQQAIADGKKDTIEELSNKINSYSDLSDFLTVKDQLGNLSSIVDNKKLLSRTFGILTALFPHGADTITMSELSINLAEDAPTISFDAQANAGSEPFIDYNVLDSFKKSMQYMRYDYGSYVDKEGAEIPAYCIIESGADGATFFDTAKQSYYAYWLIQGEGCDPSYEEEENDDKEDSNKNNKNTVNTSDTANTDNTTDINNTTDTNSTTNADNIADVNDTTNMSNTEIVAEIPATFHGYALENYNGVGVVKIWRTPQFNDWYKKEEKAGKPYMGTDGTISNVPHFESSCITYSGTEAANGSITWTSSNPSCLLVPNGIEGIDITDSSNGRDSSAELVLRFSATITLAEEAYSFDSKHFLAIGPTGRYNVTDSYVQIQNMFAERAADCAPGDTACLNTGGGN